MFIIANLSDLVYFTEMCLISPDAGLYSFINQGALTVDGIDDVEEMKLCDVSLSRYIHISIFNSYI